MGLIMVNFPSSAEDYGNGNGEGMWLEVPLDVKMLYDRDHEGGGFTGKLQNHSLYYPGLGVGVEVPFEMRGAKRPVVPFDWLSENYGQSHRDEALKAVAGL